MRTVLYVVAALMIVATQGSAEYWQLPEIGRPKVIQLENGGQVSFVFEGGGSAFHAYHYGDSVPHIVVQDPPGWLVPHR